MQDDRQNHPFADLLRQHRKAARLTQTDLATRAGISRRDISDLECGRIQRPHLDTVERLAQALALPEEAASAFQNTARMLWDHMQIAPAPDEARALMRLLARGTTGAMVAFVGRQHDLAQIAQVFDPHAPPLALMTGEPGIGKSRMLYELGRYAVATNWRVVVGICGRRHMSELYTPLPSLLRRTVRATPPEHLARELAGCAWLCRLAPDLIDFGLAPPTTQASPESERRMVLAAFHRYLRQIARQADTLVLLDDLQWASPDALDLLADVLEDIEPDQPLRVIGAFRADEEATTPVGRWIAECGRRLGVHPHRLQPLPKAEAAHLLDLAVAAQTDQAPLPSWRAAVIEHAGGNPFYLVSYAQEWHIPHARAASAEAVPVPATVADAIRARLLALSPAVRQVLALLAIGGPRLPLELFARITKRTPEYVVRALERAAIAEIVVQHHATFRFAHRLIREVLVGDLSLPRRRMLHRQVAEALENDADGAAERFAPLLAHHFIEAGLAARALPYAVAAGDQAEAVFAHHEAERWYRQVLYIANRHAQHTIAAHTAAKLGGILALVGRFAEAIALLTQALDDFRSVADHEGMSRAAYESGLYYIVISPEEGIRQIGPVLQEVQAHLTPASRADLYAMYACCHVFAARYAEALEIARLGYTLAEATDDPVVLARAQFTLGIALLWRGAIAPTREMLEQATKWLKWNQDLLFIGNAYDGLKEIALCSGDVPTARKILAQLVTMAEEWGLARAAFYTYYQSGIMAFHMGDWQLARIHLEKSRSSVNATFIERLPIAWLALLESAQGQAEAACEHAARARELLQAGPVLRFDREAYLALAQMLVLQGRHQDVVDLLDVLSPLLGDVNERLDLDLVPLLPLLAEAYLGLGDDSTATMLAERAVTLARSIPHAPALLDALRVQARLALRRQCWEAAEADLAEALASARAMSHPYAEARLLQLAGELCLARGDVTQAHNRFAAAAAICTRLGEKIIAGQIVTIMTQRACI